MALGKVGLERHNLVTGRGTETEIEDRDRRGRERVVKDALAEG